MDARTLRRAIGTAFSSLAIGAAALTCAPAVALAEPASVQPLYYLENQYTGESMFTVDRAERESMRENGWTYMKVSLILPTESASPVYRLYNPYTDDHIFTQDANEYQQLTGYGWQQEGAKFYSDDDRTAPMYRLFASWIDGQGSHLYTTSESYYESRIENGWDGDGARWYGLRVPTSPAELYQGIMSPDLDYAESDDPVPPTEPTLPDADDVTDGEGREDIVEFAKQFVGWPYVNGAEDPADGFDCSGLVQYVYGQFGLDLPRTTWDQIAYLRDMGIWKTDIDDLRPGAIIAMDGGSHVGIYAGRDPETGLYMMVDAANSLKGVAYREVYSIYWGYTFMGGANPL